MHGKVHVAAQLAMYSDSSVEILVVVLQMNGPMGDASLSNNIAQGTGVANGAKPWEHVWTVDEMRSSAFNWHLANDAGVCYHFLKIPFRWNHVLQ